MRRWFPLFSAFLASVGLITAQTFFTEGFESFNSGYTFPTSGSGWTQVVTNDNDPWYDPEWGVNAGTHHPSGASAHGGSNVAWFNSWDVSSGSAARLISPTIDLTNAAVDPTLEFWMFRDDGFSSSYDHLKVYLSTDGGNTWTELADYQRYSSRGDYWEQKTLPLTGAAGKSSVKIAFEGISGWGNDIHIDDIKVYAPSPMQYQDSWAEQVTGTASAGDQTVAVLDAIVETDGTLNPLSATQLDFTLPSGILPYVDAVDLWYTGGSAVFDPNTATWLGTISNPRSAVSFTVNQQLSQGMNHFWLTFDVNPNAPLLAQLDAQFTAVEVGNTMYTPSITDPAGAVWVWYDYCDSYAFSMSDTYCSGVIIGNWANYSTTASGSVYENYVGVIPPLQLYPGQTYPVTIIKDDDNRSYFYSGEVALYIDWNADGDYDDPNEQVFWTAHSGSSNGPLYLRGSFTVPPDARPGITGMRVLVYENSISSACHFGTWGETEDYAVEIVGLELIGDGNFGTVGSEKRKTVTLRNPSSVDLTVTDVATNTTAFAAFVPGTYTPISMPVTIPAGQEISAEIAFGNPLWNTGGQWIDQATITYTDGNYTFPALNLPLDGYYASLEAYQGQTDLLAPGAYFDLGGADLGATQPLQSTLMLQPDQFPVDPTAPIEISNWWIEGPDAALFSITGMPPVITGQVGLIVTMQVAGMPPGVKQAFLHIQHSGANGPETVIELQGRIGNPILAAPTVVYTPPLARGYSYSSPFENVAFVPLTVPQPIDVEMYGTPMLTGAGANRFELIGNGGMYYLRGQFDASGNVIPAGPLTDPANWKAATAQDPVVVTATQPWLLVVRMREAGSQVPIGAYNADLDLSAVSNAMNSLVVTIVGQLVNDPTILELYPPQLSFGTVPVGNRLAKQLILRNQSGVAGNADLTLTGSDYHFGNGQQTKTVALPATNDPVMVTIYFEPTGVGQRSGQLTATGVINGAVPLDGTGVAANPNQIEFMVNGNTIAPNGTIDFGTVQVGQIGEQQLEIVNHSVAPIQVTGVARGGNNPTQFAVPFTPPLTIGPNGGSGTIPVQFVPTNTSPATKQAQLVVYISNGVQSFSYLFNLQGEASYQGGGGPVITITPSTYNYGNQSATQTFTVENQSSTAYDVTYALILGSTNFSLVNPPTFPQTLAANGGTLDLDVAFDAQSGTSGLRSASLLAIVPGVTPYPTATLRGTVGPVTQGDAEVESILSAGALELLPIAPNPVRTNQAVLRYRVKEDVGAVQFQLFNEAGEKVRTAVGSGTAGEHSLTLDIGTLPAGRYVVRLQVPGTVLEAALVILK